jgi:uncharacterized protein
MATLSTDTPPDLWLAQGRIMHRRCWPKVHQFAYSLFWWVCPLSTLIDLEASPSASRWPGWLLGVEHPAFYSFYATDHWPSEHCPPSGAASAGSARLLAQLAQLAQAHQTPWEPAADRVWLITHWRVGGYVFNPISLYYLSQTNGAPLAVVAEVGNTFGEQKPYWLPLTGCQHDEPVFTLTCPKHFYVSPFGDVEEQFAFKVVGHPLRPGFHVDVQVLAPLSPETSPQPVVTKPLTRFISWQHVDAVTLATPGRLLWLTLCHPMVTLGVIGAIHWQALRLWLKGIPWVPKHNKAAQQTGWASPRHKT